MAQQKPMLMGKVGECVRVIRACGQRREGRCSMGGRGGAKRPDEWLSV